MGALKGRWQSLRGLRIPIRTKADHLRACNWVSCCILMHNAVLDIDGWVAGVEFLPAHGRAQEAEDRGERDDPLDVDLGDDSEARRRELVAEIVAAREMGLV